MGRNYVMQGKNDQSKYQDAVVLLERCLAIQKLIHGENHSDTIQTVLGLVKIYEKQENYEEAKNILHSSLFAQKSIHTERELLEKNPTTLQTIFCLAKIYEKQKDYDINDDDGNENDIHLIIMNFLARKEKPKQ